MKVVILSYTCNVSLQFEINGVHVYVNHAWNMLLKFDKSYKVSLELHMEAHVYR